MSVTTGSEKYTEDQLAEFKDKKVVVTRNLPEPNEKGESAVEIEGTVQIGNALGLLIKPKGKTNFELIPAAEIEEVVLAKESNKALKRSKLQHVKLGQARRHLLERHGIALAWVNNATEEQALEYHNSLNHEELDLGHVHVEKSKDEPAGDESSTED